MDHYQDHCHGNINKTMHLFDYTIKDTLGAHTAVVYVCIYGNVAAHSMLATY